MMMLDVGQAVAHGAFPGAYLARPENPLAAIDRHLSGHKIEIAVHHEFRTDGAGTKFGGRQIQVVLARQHVVGKLIPRREPDPSRRTLGNEFSDHVLERKNYL